MGIVRARDDSCNNATAAARQLALLVYRMLTYNMPYHHTSAAEYDTRQRTRILRGLRKRATRRRLNLASQHARTQLTS